MSQNKFKLDLRKKKPSVIKDFINRKKDDSFTEIVLKKPETPPDRSSNDEDPGPSQSNAFDLLSQKGKSKHKGKPPTSRTSKPKITKSSKRNQPNLLDLCSSRKSKLPSTVDGVNLEELQLAVALSKSIEDQKMEKPFSTVQVQEKQRDKENPVKMILDDYGFKYNNNQLDYDLANVITKNVKSKFRFRPSVLLKITKENRDKIISKNVEKVLLDNPSVSPINYRKNDRNLILNSFLLQGYKAFGDSVVQIAACDEPVKDSMGLYFVRDLVIPQFVECGHLLREWKSIPGMEEFKHSGDLKLEMKSEGSQESLEDVENQSCRKITKVKKIGSLETILENSEESFVENSKITEIQSLNSIKTERTVSQINSEGKQKLVEEVSVKVRSTRSRKISENSDFSSSDETLTSTRAKKISTRNRKKSESDSTKIEEFSDTSQPILEKDQSIRKRKTSDTSDTKENPLMPSQIRTLRSQKTSDRDSSTSEPTIQMNSRSLRSRQKSEIMSFFSSGTDKSRKSSKVEAELKYSVVEIQERSQVLVDCGTMFDIRTDLKESADEENAEIEKTIDPTEELHEKIVCLEDSSKEIGRQSLEDIIIKDQECLKQNLDAPTKMQQSNKSENLKIVETFSSKSFATTEKLSTRANIQDFLQLKETADKKNSRKRKKEGARTDETSEDLDECKLKESETAVLEEESDGACLNKLTGKRKKVEVSMTESPNFLLSEIEGTNQSNENQHATYSVVEIMEKLNEKSAETPICNNEIESRKLIDPEKPEIAEVYIHEALNETLNYDFNDSSRKQDGSCSDLFEDCEDIDEDMEEADGRGTENDAKEQTSEAMEVDDCHKNMESIEVISINSSNISQSQKSLNISRSSEQNDSEVIVLSDNEEISFRDDDEGNQSKRPTFLDYSTSVMDSAMQSKITTLEDKNQHEFFLERSSNKNSSPEKLEKRKSAVADDEIQDTALEVSYSQEDADKAKNISSEIVELESSHQLKNNEILDAPQSPETREDILVEPKDDIADRLNSQDFANSESFACDNSKFESQKLECVKIALEESKHLDSVDKIIISSKKTQDLCTRIFLKSPSGTKLSVCSNEVSSQELSPVNLGRNDSAKISPPKKPERNAENFDLNGINWDQDDFEIGTEENLKENPIDHTSVEDKDEYDSVFKEKQNYHDISMDVLDCLNESSKFLSNSGKSMEKRNLAESKIVQAEVTKKVIFDMEDDYELENLKELDRDFGIENRVGKIFDDYEGNFEMETEYDYQNTAGPSVTEPSSQESLKFRKICSSNLTESAVKKFSETYQFSPQKSLQSREGNVNHQPVCSLNSASQDSFESIGSLPQFSQIPIQNSRPRKRNVSSDSLESIDKFPAFSQAIPIPKKPKSTVRFESRSQDVHNLSLDSVECANRLPSYSQDENSPAHNLRKRKILSSIDRNLFDFRNQMITPERDYKKLNINVINQETKKFGLKNLSKKRAIKILELIYNETHPHIKIVSEEQENTLVELESKGLVTNIGHDDDFVFQPCLLENEECIFPKKRPSKKILGCQVPLHIAFYNMVRSDKSLQNRILQYDNLILDDLVNHFKFLNLPYHEDDVISFLDRRCIAYKKDHKNLLTHMKDQYKRKFGHPNYKRKKTGNSQAT